MELLLPHLGLLFWTLIAFLATFFILSKYAWKPIMKAIKNRENKIEEAIQNTKELEQKLKSLQQENEAVILKVREEKADILKKAAEEANQIIEDSKTKAKNIQNKTLEQTQEEIETMKAKVFNEIKDQVTDLVFTTTEKILKEKMKDKEMSEKIILDSLKSFKLN